MSDIDADDNGAYLKSRDKKSCKLYHCDIDRTSIVVKTSVANFTIMKDCPGPLTRRFTSPRIRS